MVIISRKIFIVEFILWFVCSNHCFTGITEKQRSTFCVSVSLEVLISLPLHGHFYFNSVSVDNFFVWNLFLT
jgi:hypothetical protein